MKKSTILLACALASVPCAHADVLPIPAPLDIVPIIFVMIVAALVFVVGVFVLYKLYRWLRPKKKTAGKTKTLEKKKIKTKTAKKNRSRKKE